VGLASHVVVSADAGTDTNTFTAAEFRQVMKSANFVGTVAFWRQLERFADPETLTRIHGHGRLGGLARSYFANCSGMAFSPQQDIAEPNRLPLTSLLREGQRF
jgi:hypothetical protein